VVTKKQAKDFYSSLQLPKKSSPQQILLHCYVASQNQIERQKSFYGIPVWSLNHVTQMATTANGR
jgi:Tat protein secretion system quality control protein TatD with DNase activity